jgi:hypothetical protein
MELEAAREILAEVFGVRLSDIDEMSRTVLNLKIRALIKRWTVASGVLSMMGLVCSSLAHPLLQWWR